MSGGTPPPPPGRYYWIPEVLGQYGSSTAPIDHGSKRWTHNSYFTSCDERTTREPQGSARERQKRVNQVPLKLLREWLSVCRRHAEYPIWFARATSHHSNALRHKADLAVSQDTVLQNTLQGPTHAQLIVCGDDYHLQLGPPTMQRLRDVTQKALHSHASTHRGHTLLGTAHVSAYVHTQELTAAGTTHRALQVRDAHTPLQCRLRAKEERLSGVSILPNPCLFCGGRHDPSVHMHPGCVNRGY